MSDQEMLIEELLMLDGRERLEWLMERGAQLQPMPAHLRQVQHVIAGCISTTLYVARVDRDTLYIYGESNSRVMAGVIHTMQLFFSGLTPAEVLREGIRWPEAIGLYDLLTPQRRAAVEQIVTRTLRACEVVR